ncbi:hypothetical protein PHYSODRAFT_558338 [Phytophthora sojae]|uniref:Uncharacterized protein n=1 Tax=Phytophthora sojae (strain P6497) TaxID=1094619 RepID=G4Z6M6_PHYSP|nr:hypothetical protein PHYSODRAFT_558338 [Phytophthora sojae]EGZ19596.1 hypothetical protein PHYSODRAFT_558338 [Phytophthora sojae]|eukprot:XP_009522313.1 hypothetical protein PHYSODRAFT_558338 [Phytophthora sojae]
MNPPPISQAVRLSPSPSDLIPVNEPSDRRQQNFRPSRAQQEVHDAISAPAYIGKDGDVYMDHVRTSTATKFLAHPAIASRLFDIEFSACDLSILHFPRFALDSQLDRSKAKAVNMRNFSSKVALPELPDKPMFSDLTEALSVLYTFAKEFFNEETRDIFAAAKDFGEQLEDFAPWSSSEVHILAFWFSNIIGAYRLAVVEDMRSGYSTRHSETTLWLGKELSVGTVRNLRKSRPKFQRKTDRQLCLRYASVQGCSSKSKDRCLQSFLAHFEPAELPEAVAAYIRDTYGGVRTFAKQE